MKPAPDFVIYDRFIVTLSGGKDSLSCLLYLIELGIPLSKIELWHHLVDGREGSNLMDWRCTESYCKALADAFHLPIYFSWLEGGFEREMLRNDQRKAPTWFETPEGLYSAGGNSAKLGTRLKFPQLSASLSVRWCSAYLKIDVCSIALNNQERFKGKRTLILSGERAEESANRAKYPEFEPDRSHSADRHIDRWRPVLHWSSDRVWGIIKNIG